MVNKQKCLIQTDKTIISRPFLEYVPPVAEGNIPCYEDGVDDSYISTRLSCMAIENNIYIGANYGSVVPGCDHSYHGGECYHNTLVLFSNNGSMVGKQIRFLKLSLAADLHNIILQVFITSTTSGPLSWLNMILTPVLSLWQWTLSLECWDWLCVLTSCGDHLLWTWSLNKVYK